MSFVEAKNHCRILTRLRNVTHNATKSASLICDDGNKTEKGTTENTIQTLSENDRFVCIILMPAEISIELAYL